MYWNLYMIRRNDPIMVDAVRRGDLREVRRLYEEEGVSVDSFALHYKVSAVHRACLSGRKDILEYLIEKGASLNVKNRDGYTPLDYAVHDDQRSCIPLLLMNGADDASRDNEGKISAFECALREDIYRGRKLVPRPYAQREIWDSMKIVMCDSTRDLILGCAATAAAAGVVKAEDETFLSSFMSDVPESMMMMKDVMGFFSVPLEFGPELNPRFLDKRGALYQDVARCVMRGFHTTAVRKKPLRYFEPFINKGRREGFSMEWITEMMRVLAGDRDDRVGIGWSEAEKNWVFTNDMNLHLSSLVYDEERDIVSLSEEVMVVED